MLFQNWPTRQINILQVLQMITVGVIGLGAAVVGIIKGNTKLEDSLADIRKTSKLTVDEVKKLNTKLGKIDTRTSRSDLREMVVVAGQLGIAQKDVPPFIDSSANSKSLGLSSAEVMGISANLKEFTVSTE